MELTSYQNKFVIRKSANHSFTFAREVSKNLNIPIGQILGLVGNKIGGVNEIESIYRATLKESPKNPSALFLWKVAKLPNKHKLRQHKLPLI